MYDSSWQKSSRSSHPNLWSPPIVTPMSRGAISETETDLSRQCPLQNPNPDHRRERLPSVDEILLRISTQEALRQPYPPALPVLPSAYPQGYPGQPQLSISHWHRGPLPPTQYQTAPRAPLEQETLPVAEHHTQLSQETGLAGTLAGTCSPQAQLTPAKKRGRKKKSDTICSHCQLTQTPEWRRGPDGSRTLCNACGLFYLKLTKKFGFDDANMIFAYKKRHNEVQDRIVPTVQQKNRYLSETGAHT